MKRIREARKALGVHGRSWKEKKSSKRVRRCSKRQERWERIKIYPNQTNETSMKTFEGPSGK